LEDFVLLFSLYAVSLHDVVVVVGALKSCLHAGQLVLDAIQLNTSLFTSLTNFAHFFLLFAELQIDTFMLVR
jgi:hypothetical protein